MFTSRKLKAIKNLIIENGGGTLNAKTLDAVNNIFRALQW